jgi:riboflavin kinase/FMN adenylyltransferase
VDVVNDPARCPSPPDGTVVTIGSYDGVHVGHRAVLAEVRDLADKRGCDTAVVTFEPHPAAVVRPESAPLLLTDLEQKLELLEACQVDHVVVIAFDEARSRQTAAEFVAETLVHCLRGRAVVVGHDFHFGHRRQGNVPYLAEQGSRYGFDVFGLSLHGEAGAAVSSTRIRNLLQDGDVETAAVLLGRPHEVRGVVGRGDLRGREWGFPTANVAVPPGICLPDDGVYAGFYVHPDGAETPAAISLGRRPQVYEDTGERLLEPHLLGWSGDLYDQPARVRFTHRLRGQERFPEVDDLIAQIGRDVEAARTLLGAAPA